jgi:hypothetical protein
MSTAPAYVAALAGLAGIITEQPERAGRTSRSLMCT